MNGTGKRGQSIFNLSIHHGPPRICLPGSFRYRVQNFNPFHRIPLSGGGGGGGGERAGEKNLRLYCIGAILMGVHNI